MCSLCHNKGVVIEVIAPPRPLPKQHSAIGLLPGQEPDPELMFTHPYAREYLRPCDCQLACGEKRMLFSEMVRAMDSAPIVFN
jgi:hypothetical protein